MAKLVDEGGELVLSGRVEDLKVDRPIALDHPVPQLGRLCPRDVGEARLDLVGELAGGPAHDREVPQQGVAALPVPCEFLDSNALDQITPDPVEGAHVAAAAFLARYIRTRGGRNRTRTCDPCRVKAPGPIL